MADEDFEENYKGGIKGNRRTDNRISVVRRRQEKDEISERETEIKAKSWL